MKIALLLLFSLSLAAESTNKTSIDAKLTSAYWHAAFDASQAQAVKEKADAEVQRAADAIKASCAGEVQPSGRDFVCVIKADTKPEAPKGSQP